MKKILALVLSLWATGAAAQGTFPLNNLPLGKGPGKTGFTALAPGANGTCLLISGGVPTFTTCPLTAPGGSDQQVQINNTGAFGGITNTQLTARINVFTSGLLGAVPASGGGTTNFLRADGTFAAPTSGIGANPTATASDTAVNGVSTNFMRSDAAPAVQKATNTQFGLAEGDNLTVTCATGICGQKATSVTNSLGADVTLNNAGTFFDGPSTAQGTSGTWFASGTVTLLDTAASVGFRCKLWDGTTVIASAQGGSSAANASTAISLSGVLASPAANIKISCEDFGATTGLMKFNASGLSKDSTLTVRRIQ